MSGGVQERVAEAPCAIYISDLWRETLFKIEYDTRLNKTPIIRDVSIRCYDHGSLPGGCGLELGPQRKRGRQSRGRVENLHVP